MYETDSLRHALWRLLRPVPEEIIFAVFIIIFAFGLAAYQLSVGGAIGSESRDAVLSLNGLVRQAIDAFDGASIAAKALLFGFWFLVGTALYFVIWFCISLAIDIYNDIVISAAFIHPRSFHQSQYWAAIVGRTIVRGLASLALVVYLFIGLRILGPGYLHSAKAVIQHAGSTTILTFTLSSLVCIVAAHLAVILYRVAFYRVTESTAQSLT